MRKQMPNILKIYELKNNFKNLTFAVMNGNQQELRLL